MLNYYLIRSIAIINNSKPSVFLSKFLFKNNCGILSNLYGEIRKSLSNSVEIKKNKDITFLKENNYLWLKLPKSKMNQLDNLTKKFDQFCNTCKVPKSLRLEVHSKMMNNKNKEILKLSENMLSEDVIKSCEGYFGKRIGLQNHHMYRNFSPNTYSKHDKNMYGSTDQWHVDCSPTNTLKVFVLPHDIKLEHGPMEYRPLVFKNKLNAQKLNTTGSKGDILIINTNLIEHRATYPAEDKTRDLLCYNIETK
jgi:hypothetical protein